MEKLFKLKEWLTLPDAVRHLSIVFGEEVSTADVLRLALDGHLKLSVYFVNHANARCGKTVPLEQAEMDVWSHDKNKGRMTIVLRGVHRTDEQPEEIKAGLHDQSLFLVQTGIDVGDNEVLELDKEIRSLTGIWDLQMRGVVKLDVEHRFQQETGGPEVTLTALQGAFVEGPNGQLCQLQERFEDDWLKKHRKSEEELPYNHTNNYFPAGMLPTDSVLVVRTKALAELCERVSETDPAKKRPLGERAETTYLNIIAGLLGLMLGTTPSGKKISSFDSQASVISALLANYPRKSGIAQRTLEDKFADAKRSLGPL